MSKSSHQSSGLQEEWEAPSGLTPEELLIMQWEDDGNGQFPYFFNGGPVVSTKSDTPGRKPEVMEYDFLGSPTPR